MKSSTYFIAYLDANDEMLPVTNGHRRIRIFTDIDEARYEAGPLGVAAPQTWRTLTEVCQRYGLAMPEEGD